MDAIAHKHKASPGQIALAWLLKRSPVMLPIPGTGKVAHLEENVAAAAIKLTDEEFDDPRPRRARRKRDACFDLELGDGTRESHFPSSHLNNCLGSAPSP